MNNTGTWDNAINLDPLAKIYNEGQWKVYKVSPLFNLQYGTVRLKQYSTKIRQTIASEVLANSSVKYTVSVVPAPQLKYSEDDPHGLIIEVNITHNLNSKIKLAYTAILLSWGVNCKFDDDIVYLPYMLERGEQKIGAVVRSTLQTLFDCFIKQFTFTQRHILALGLNFLQYDTSKETQPFALMYKTPQVDVDDKLTFSFEIGDMRIIWNGIKNGESRPSQQVVLAHQMIQNQIAHVTNLDISTFNLTEVSLPKGGVKSSGIVKMKSAEIVKALFMVLNNICAAKYIKGVDNISVTPSA